MNTVLWIFFSLIVLQRVIELIIAKRNEHWMKERGGIERGTEHYKFFVLIHSLFFIAILIETTYWQVTSFIFHRGLFILFILAQLGRVWCISSLGRYWNTKIIILPKSSLVQKGPYKYMKHPNYVIVAIELFVIPLLFGAVVTAIIFPMIHLLFVYKVRIPIEEAALAEVQNGQN